MLLSHMTISGSISHLYNSKKTCFVCILNGILKGVPCSFEEIKTQNLYMYNINEVIIQTQKFCSITE